MDTRIAAVSALRLISEPLSSEGPFNKEKCMESWFSEDAPSALKVAALEYLSDCGTTADLTTIKSEFDRGDYQTSRAAVDAILSIKLRDSRANAILALLELQPQSINPSLLTSLFDDSNSIRTEILRQGVGHRSSEVRRIVVRLLRQRGELERETAEQLISDGDAVTRFGAFQTLIEVGMRFSDDEARKILVRPKAMSALGFFAVPRATDIEGESVWDQFRERRLSEMTDDELQHAAISNVLNRSAEFVLDERRFATRGDSLRAAVDNHFKDNFAEIVQKMRKLSDRLSDSENKLIEETISLEEYLTKKFTRKGLDIICGKGDPQDVGRVRQILDSGFVEYSNADTEYLRKVGEWEDIPRIIGSLERMGGGRGTLLESGKNNCECRDAARVIYALGRKRLAELLFLPAPGRQLSRLIVDSTQKDLAALDDTSIISLFRSEHDGVRKAAALKCVQVLPKGRLTKLLNQYFAGEWYRYYNVVHWLDFGVSIPRPRARSAAATVLAKMW